MADLLTGVDSSTVCNKVAATCLKKSGYSFLIRYYRSRDSKKNRLTRNEALTITAAGLLIGVVFEFSGTDADYFTPAQGVRDAEDALAGAAAVGQPQGSAIYFAVDFDADPDKGEIAGPVTSYFRSVSKLVRPKYRIGAYGSGAVCAHLLDNALIDLAWLSQSTKFHGTSTFTRWSLKQGRVLPVCKLDTDLDDGHGDFGGFAVS